MDRFCIITNVEKDVNFEITHYIETYFIEHQKSYYLVVNENPSMYQNGDFIEPSKIPDDVECAIVLGGDGTMILAANDLVDKDIPIIGVNLGTLGFLTEIDKSHIYETLDALLLGEYKVEPRLMVEGNVYSEGQCLYNGYALNDIVVTRKDVSGLITVKVSVNDEVVNTYRGDGVIISTPTGSTSYNLSAGGPVVSPSAQIMIITPICPHALNNRSIIVTTEDKIRVEIGQRTQRIEEAIVTFDGRESIHLKSKDIVEIGKAAKETKLIKVKKSSFYDLLRTKLGEE